MRDLRVRLPTPCAEPWEDMAPAGCNRRCESCDQIIFDLAELTIDEAEALASSGEEICVRAKVDREGKVTLKSDGWANARRMIAVIGASAGLLGSSNAALAKVAPTTGEIAGMVEYHWGPGYVVATSADGKSYRTKIKRSGKYKLRDMPPGTYKLQFSGWCSDEYTWNGGEAVVAADLTTKKDTTDTGGCIIVGKLIIESDTSEG